MSTKIIPFCIDKWKAGLKPIYRNNTYPQFVCTRSYPTNFVIGSVNEGGDYNSHTQNGFVDSCRRPSSFDLFLETVSCKVPLEPADFIKDGPWWIVNAGVDDCPVQVLRIFRFSLLLANGHEMTFEELRTSKRANGRERDVEEKLVWHLCEKDAL